MTTYETLLIERRGPVEWLTLNRPDRLNAINAPMINDLADHVAELQTDTSVRVVVLQGAGRAFSAGLDIKASLAGGVDRTSLDRLPSIILGLRSCPQVVVALVHGAACGGGFAMALASDIRILGESARMNDAFVMIGGSGCELGLSYFLPRHVGLSVASELMLTGRFLDAHRAQALGLTARVVPDDELVATAEELIGDLLRVGPLALRKTKETLQRVMGLDDLERVMQIELATQEECMSGADFREGLRAFTERRAPVFQNG